MKSAFVSGFLGVVLAIVLGALGQWLFAGLALAFGIVAAMVMSIRHRAEGLAQDPLDRVSNENRSRLLPLKRLAREIEEIATANSGHAVIRVLGAEAKADVGRILEQAIELLNLRTRMTKALAGEVAARKALEEARTALESADAATAETLQSAIVAREMELAHYIEARRIIDTVDAQISQAHAALSELKTRFALAASGEVDQDNLRDALGRMRALSATFEEAETWMSEEA